MLAVARERRRRGGLSSREAKGRGDREGAGEKTNISLEEKGKFLAGEYERR